MTARNKVNEFMMTKLPAGLNVWISLNRVSGLISRRKNRPFYFSVFFFAQKEKKNRSREKCLIFRFV